MKSIKRYVQLKAEELIYIQLLLILLMDTSRRSLRAFSGALPLKKEID